MNLPANFPLKKVMITVVSVVIVIALIITGVTVAVNGKAANATVDVEQVSNISTQYWGDQSSTYGNATSDFVQELYPDKEKAISKIFVKEGDTVKIGDTLLQYDTTKLQLKVESKELEEKKKKYELEQAEKELTKLQNTAPYVEPVIPEPEPEPEKKSNAGMLLLVLGIALIGGGAGWYFKVYRPKHQQADQTEEDDGGDYPDYDEFEDDGPPWDEEDETEEKEEIR